MKTKFKITSADYIRANRKAARAEELAEHLRPVIFRSIHKSKKLYDRKKSKADLNKGLPYLFLENEAGGFMNPTLQIA